MTETAPGGRLQTNEHGVISVQPFTLPLSAALSPMAAKRLAAALQQESRMPDFSGAQNEAQFRSLVDAFRHGLNEGFLKPMLARMAVDFPVQMQGDVLGGVNVEEFTPLSGVDESCVLINLHGGAFLSGAVLGGRVESIPLAHLGKFRIISVDYRQGYEHRYPAASEDVEAVYRALLQRYPASRIGIYGGSAGGALTAQATAWILDKGLPPPGAIGIFGAGSGGAGDSAYFSAIGTGRQPPMDLMAELRTMKYSYLDGTSPDDILIRPHLAPPEFRAKFPPTLLITGTRAFDMSPAIATHRALCQAGVEAKLHVFDGHGHCFYYDAWLPESADANATITRFFRKHLK
ncbi:MAG TPA: alpha/beta hydrolase fold domain-containing protein [Acidocella sp.]|nr:alpha/beta hydrolase fold domain-containing protein [Acidocella sp.]